MTNPPASPDFLGLTARIVAAHVAKNHVPAGDLPPLIESVYKALTGCLETAPAAAPAPVPAVPVKKSVFPDYIICLEDGEKLKMLRRHLATSHNMTPEQYRERWGLPANYPMVAPNYADHRSSLAKQIGLGRRSKGIPAPAPAPAPQTAAKPPRKAGGRKGTTSAARTSAAEKPEPNPAG
jgi:predicted transcriptional regulator